MHYVYILRNKKDKSLYIGYSDKLEERLKQHRSRYDIQLLYYEAYISEKDARQRERKLKLYGSAWRGLKQRLRDTLSQKA